MAVTEAQSAEVDPKVREIIADLMRRVGELEKQNGDAEKWQAASEKRQAEDAKVLAKIEAQIPFLATKEDVATLDKKIEVGLANGRTELADFRTEALAAIANLTTLFAKLETQIAKMETQNERNSKNSIKWNVGIGVALIGVIATATGIILAALPS